MPASLFQLRTAHGSRICQSPVTGEVAHALDRAGNDARSIYLFVPKARASVGFMIGELPGGTPLRLPDDPFRQGILSFRLQHDAPAGTVALIHPITDKIMCAAPLDADAFAALPMDRDGIGDWESFRLSVVEAPEAVIRLAARLQAMITAVERDGLAVVPVVEDDLPIFLACAALFGADEVARLARRLRTDPPLADGVSKATTDPWLATALPILLAWEQERHASSTGSERQAAASPGSSSRYVAGPDLNAVGDAGKHGWFVSLGHHLNASARRQVRPTRGACLVATARNEGIYLLEWVAHHRRLGFDHLFICSNDNTDGSDALLAALADAGVITWTTSLTDATVRPQFKAYGHALQVIPAVLDFDWAGFIDIDEFVMLNPARYGSIGEYLAWMAAHPTDAFGLPWRMMLSETEGWTDAPVARRFTRALNDPSRHQKSFMRPHLFNYTHAHTPQTPTGDQRLFRTASGEVQPFTPFTQANFEHAWINHYLCKSPEEYAWRRTLSRVDLAFQPGVALERLDESRLVDFFRFLDDVPDVATPDAHPVDVTDEVSRLLALPGVAAARGRVLTAFRDDVATLKRQIVTEPRFSMPGSLAKRFADLMAS